MINQGLSVLLRLAESEDPSTRAMCADTLCELSRSRKGCPRVVKDGEVLEFHIAGSRLHLFDADTELSLRATLNDNFNEEERE